MSLRRAAVVDIGTNSVLLTIAARTTLPADPEGAPPSTPRGSEDPAAAPRSVVERVVEPVLERATITRLGEGVDATRKLSPAAVDRTLECLRDYGARIREAGVDVIALVGTSALRDAQGGEAFMARAAELIGAPLEVISGQREAELTFRGALSGLDVRGPVTVFDIGGGSTEIISGDAPLPGALRANPGGPRAGAPTLRASFSFDVGSVRLTERHVRTDPPRASELDALRKDIRALLSTAPPALATLFRAPTDAEGAAAQGAAAEGTDAEDLPRPPSSHAHSAAAPPTVVGVAGTVTTLAAVEFGLEHYDPMRVHGATLSAESIDGLVTRLASLPLAERQKLPGLEPRRADVIVAGAVLCSEVLRALGAPRLVVSDRGVRWGLLDELLFP